MKNVLITGGAGFIGSNLTKRLLENGGFNITILDNFLPQIHGDVRNLNVEIQSKVRLIIGDVTDKKCFYESLKEQDIVIHLAAETGTGQSMYNVSHYANVNIQGTALLCDFLVNEEHAISKVIVASSRSIYGEGKYFSQKFGNVYPKGRSQETIKSGFEVLCPITGEQNLILQATDEEALIHPSSIYGITKQVQEQMIILSTGIKKIDSFALRFQNVYGPGQSLKNPYTGILSVFSRQALQGQNINIFEDGLESRDFVFIDDIVESILLCLSPKVKGQHILNVGSGERTSVLEVAQEIVSYLKSNSKIEVSGAFREGDIRHNYADLEKIKNTLGFSPKWTFTQGIRKFLDWVLIQNDIPSSLDDYINSIKELKDRGLYK
ncbi:NAD dependent epimerase/dehydratase family protein [Sphingobacterium spiritivorum ATCC 33300]|uniref:NAD dependent epimerase/dehydratase family protein n=1 Tax=Sphingobacterium spiritivorum ATCC 33300 TaxID=525372 RepID=C2G0V4_SPHSI|nr:NAD-dependent epimerase/dehydratase family protein [Sphingobacterium spiritivorum]EEI91184.1 NAD dependent epimerase/dehydratase family protein [Sphingobacterium spiritivorum ATCC 33300]QQS97574.1 NAD-dependent epimerase/dehydratase family protein [Sphingobacterium spiritivorum]